MENPANASGAPWPAMHWSTVHPTPFHEPEILTYGGYRQTCRSSDIGEKRNPSVFIRKVKAEPEKPACLVQPEQDPVIAVPWQNCLLVGIEFGAK
jgi:hypothetical protein